MHSVIFDRVYAVGNFEVHAPPPPGKNASYATVMHQPSFLQASVWSCGSIKEDKMAALGIKVDCR